MKFLLTLAIFVLALSSCVTTPEPNAGADYLSGLGGQVPQNPQRLDVAEPVSYWDDDGSSGQPWVLVDLNKQVAKFHRGNHVIGVAAISSGTHGRNTPAGNYKIIEKKREHFSNLYGHVEDASGRIVNDDATPRSSVPPGGKYVPAAMPYWMRLTNTGVGMHQGFLPGYPASHGCIRMDRNIVPVFYQHAFVGMPVTVVR
ncbi:hypothetical protein FEM03_03125 [Phragmitibacter flavus]|uniref:L,D-TPase catalytic domain-containing protein n=1 Tax=Phragmitibacter flavus TaxID=2576071 RepID=A0A5R8KJ67_9BACT|nr:L,D-transpeptidase family protein [Phragmitibacter flavus]TLD72363.1 hypothetical protein FEM03_03125 [Phragmitibacter flavus]